MTAILIVVALAAFAGAIAIHRHESGPTRRLRHNRKAAHLRLLSELERQR